MKGYDAGGIGLVRNNSTYPTTAHRVTSCRSLTFTAIVVRTSNLT